MFRRDGEFVHEAVWGPMLLFLASLAVFFPALVPRIPCVFKSLTNIPCLACGSTRAVMHLAVFDPLAAFRMNPLTTVFAIMAAVYVVHSILVLARLRRPWRFDPKSPAFVWVRNSAVVLIAVNWIFLVVAGR